MNEKELTKYLAENLSIEIDQIEEFGPIETINIKLELGDVIISESSCNLPSNKK